MTRPAFDDELAGIPAEVTSFIGRKRQLAQARELLGTHRLLTLTGAGGIGKTRLATRLARDLSRSFPSGVRFIELATLVDPSAVAQTVANAMGLCAPSGEWTNLVCAHIGEQRVLVVLDDCEHLIEDCAALADQLIRRCPNIRILTTSRERLGVSGEVVLMVPSLRMANDESHDEVDEAVVLFADRARSASKAFDIRGVDRDTVASICRELDGLPLAIELAAAHVATLNTAQILQRLKESDELSWLTNRTNPWKHRTLWSSLDWSYELCTSAERVLWARLSVFAGEWELDSAERICAGVVDGDDPVAAGEVLDLIQSLVDKSILARQAGRDRASFRMSETISRFGLDQLKKSGELEVMRRRHVQWYATLGHRTASEWLTPLQYKGIERLQREIGNLRTAMEYCLSQPDLIENFYYLAVEPWQSLWWASGRIEEGHRWMSRLIAESVDLSLMRTQALLVDSILSVTAGDTSLAASRVAEADELRDRYSDADTNLLLVLARVRLQLRSGDIADANSTLEQALGDASENPADPGLLGLLQLRVTTLLAQHRHDEAATVCRKILDLLADGENVYRSFALSVLGANACERGDIEDAREMSSVAFELASDFPARPGTARTLLVLACIAESDGDAERAAVIIAAADAAWREVSDVRMSRDGLTDFEDCHQRVLRRLGQRAFTKAWERGRNMESAVLRTFVCGSEARIQAPESSDSPLTRRETEVADLIAAGFTNKAIAAQLVIAVGTAEGHVERIRDKLGFTSRTQIGAWVMDRQLVGV